MSNLQPLDQIINLSDLPSEVNWLSAGLSSLLSNLYLVSYYSDSAPGQNDLDFRARVRTLQALDFDIPGTGFKLILNPSFDPANGVNHTEFDISGHVDYGILGYGGRFTAPSSFTVRELIEEALELFGLSEAQLLKSIIENLEDGYASQLVTAIDNQYGSSINPNVSSLVTEVNAENILAEIKDPANTNLNGVTVYDIFFTIYLTSASDPLEVVNKVFNALLVGSPKDIEQSILDAYIPRITARMDLSVALEFPRSLFMPMEDSGSGEYVPATDTNVKTTVEFAKSEFWFDSKGVIGFSSEVSASLQAPYDKARLLNTGLLLGFSGMKFDVSESSNLAYANMLGLPNSFKGIYADSVSIDLPQFWSAQSGSTASIIGQRVLIGYDDDNGFTVSGNFLMEADTAGDPSPLMKFELFNDALKIKLTSFNLEFEKNNVINSAIAGQFEIKGLKDASKQDAILNFSIDWGINGYEICVSEDDGLQLEIPDTIAFTLKKLCIGQVQGEWQFKVQGRIDRIRDIPVIGKAIPKFLEVKEFEYFESQANEFDLVFGWDGEPTVNITDDGFSGTTFEKTVHINKDFLGLLEVQLLNFAFNLSGNQLDITSTVNAGVKIGPLVGAVEKAGFKTIIAFPQGGGNLGPANISFELVRPAGFGVGIASPFAEKAGFSIGGYVAHDPDLELYKGALSLSFKKISASALGILSLKLPNGQKGLSFLMIIAARFKPGIDIGLGFKITGVGGITGLNRTANAEVLRKGVKDGSTNDILFPAPPIANKAPQILNTMNTAFPQKEGQFLVGPIAELSWITDSLFTIQFGLIVEFDRPVQVAILGVLRAHMPAKDAKLLRINVNFLGVIDFHRKYLSFDASIFDSGLLSISLEGDILLRVLWGNNASFLVSVGGFHPNFPKPSHMMLPADIKNLAIVIIDNKYIKIRGWTYFAVSSNTVQFGAGVYVYVGIGGFSASATVYFDVLIYYRPKFRFDAGIGAKFEVKYKRWTLFGIDVHASMSGPGRYNAHGHFRVKILFVINCKKTFNKSWGQDKTVSLPKVNVAVALTEALNQPEGWETTLPTSTNSLVILRNASELEDELLINPQSSITLRQKIVPLNVNIQRYGNAEPDTVSKFDIDAIKLLGNTFPTQQVKDQFAPAQFFAIDKDKLLKEPSFTQFKSGLKIRLRENLNYFESGEMVSINPAEKEMIFVDGDLVKYVGMYAPLGLGELEKSFAGSGAGEYFNKVLKGGGFGSFDTALDIEVLGGVFIPVDDNGQSVSGVEFESYEEGIQWIEEQLTLDETLDLDAYDIVSMADFNSYETV